jgi:HAD superfamily hydrolase (TIGR01509 family)
VRRLARATGSALVIFDCDGVLVDTEAISTRLITQAINSAGWPLTEMEARIAFQGESLANIVAAVERQIGRPLPRGWPDEFQEQRSQAFRQLGLKAIDGAAEAVAHLQRRGINVCVASQASLEKTRLTLGLTGLLEMFDARWLFSSAMVKQGKPAPDLFLHAAHVCGHQPASCVVIEDSVVGITGARAAGMRALGYAADTDPDALREAGAEVFFEMREVPDRVAATR